jgi:hypothetical protein
MADQYYDNIFIIGNIILDDIDKGEQTCGFFKDCFENFCTTWSDTNATALYPDNLSSSFRVFGDSGTLTGANKKLDCKKAFIL